MAVCCEDFHCLDDTSAVLPICRSYHYGENANETVEKIATDEKYVLCALESA